MIFQIPIDSTVLPIQKERMDYLAIAQAEVNSIVAKRRIFSALPRDIPPAADRISLVGEEVSVFPEGRKHRSGHNSSTNH